MLFRRRKTWKLQSHASHGHCDISSTGSTLEAEVMRCWYHHRIDFGKYHPGYTGKVGMRNYHLKGNQSFYPTVNLYNCGPWSVNRLE